MRMVSRSRRAETLLLQSGGRAETLLLQSIYLDSFVTEHAPEPENEENQRSMQSRKWDFSFPVMVPLLEMGVSFPVPW